MRVFRSTGFSNVGKVVLMGVADGYRERMRRDGRHQLMTAEQLREKRADALWEEIFIRFVSDASNLDENPERVVFMAEARAGRARRVFLERLENRDDPVGE